MRMPKGEAVTVPVSKRFRSNSVSAVLAAARDDGLGIALMPRYVASASLAQGKVLSFIAFLQGRFGEGWWKAA